MDHWMIVSLSLALVSFAFNLWQHHRHKVGTEGLSGAISGWHRMSKSIEKLTEDCVRRVEGLAGRHLGQMSDSRQRDDSLMQAVEGLRQAAGSAGQLREEIANYSQRIGIPIRGMSLSLYDD